MAYTDAIPSSGTMNIVQGTALQKKFAVLNASNANVNTTGWTAFALEVFQPAGVGAASVPSLSTSVAAGDANGVAIHITAADAASLPPGTYNMIANAKPTSGDDLQCLFNGTLVVGRNS